MKNKAMLINIFAIVGIVIGVAMIIVGLTMGTSFHGAYAYKETYGGDAYTGIQNAAALTSQGVSAAVNALNAVNNNFGHFVSLFGCATICFFGTKLDLSAFGTQASNGAAASSSAPEIPASRAAAAQDSAIAADAENAALADDAATGDALTTSVKEPATVDNATLADNAATAAIPDNGPEVLVVAEQEQRAPEEAASL